MSRVLVVGGAGYIGAHVCEALTASGYSVRILDDFSNGLKRRVDGHFNDVVVGNVLNREDVLSALDDVQAVIHLAAKKAVGESVTNPLKYYQNNVGGILNLLAAMSAQKVKQLVFSSTAAVYSPSDKTAIEETDPTIPLSPYGETKILSEQLISKVAQAEKFSAISLRYFNVVGSSRPEFGDNSKDNLVPKVFAAFRLGQKPEIYGEDYPTSDGTCVRDYIHVADVAAAHVVALKRTEKGIVDEVYNVGSGSGYSVREMMNQMSKTMGIDLMPQVVGRRAGDTPQLIASITKITRELGWSPKATLKEMIDSSWAAEKANS